MISCATEVTMCAMALPFSSARLGVKWPILAAVLDTCVSLVSLVRNEMLEKQGGTVQYDGISDSRR